MNGRTGGASENRHPPLSPQGVWQATPHPHTRRTDHTPPCLCTLPRTLQLDTRRGHHPTTATTPGPTPGPGPTHPHHLDDRPAYPRRPPRTRSATTRPARRAGNRTTSTPGAGSRPPGQLGSGQLDHPDHPTAPQRRRTPPRQGSAGRGTPRWTSRRGHTDLDAGTVPGQHSACEVPHTTGDRANAHPHASGNRPTPVPLDDAGQNLDSTNTAGVMHLDDNSASRPRPVTASSVRSGPPRQRGTPPPRRRQASDRPTG